MKVNKYILSICKNGMIVIIPCMLIICFTQVILRYGFNYSLSWGEELARYMLVWASCLGAVYASDKGMHVSMDIIRSKLKGKLLLLSLLCLHSCLLLFFAVCIWQGILYAQNGWFRQSPSMEIRMTYFYAAIPVSFSFMFFIQIEKFINEIKQSLFIE